MVDALLEVTRRSAALEEEQHAFLAVFEQAAVLLALLQPDGQVLRLNRAAREALRTDQRGFAFEDAPWWTPEARARVREMLPRAQRGHAVHEEISVPTRAGYERFFHLILSPSLGERGDLCFLLAQATEITAQVQSRERLHHAQRLEALGQLSGGVAHDFNNLLGAILASAQLMEMALDAGDRGQTDELLQSITSASLRASELTRKLLAFGRRDRMTTTRFDLNELLVETAALLRRTLEASIQITTAPSPDPIELEGDRAALENALINLGVNARDALLGAGELTLQATWLSPSDPRPERWPAHLPTDLDMAWIEVRDNGIGMDQATQARIFEPFFTTKALGAGTGLGLPSVQGTLEAHHGAVTVQSALGQGTSFHLFLPCAPQRAPASASLPQLSAHDQIHFQGRLLLVDDEALLRRALTHMLQRLGFEVCAAGDAQEALALLDRAAPFDMALLDVVMPGMGGVELAAALRERHPALKVAFVSGFSQQELPGGDPGEGAWLLRKPFTRDALVDFLRAHLPNAQVNGASTP
jgi:PAS domain S-box-containing protein